MKINGFQKGITVLKFLLFTLTLNAQDVTEFGKVDAALLKKPHSLIDNGAEAEVIFDVSDISFTIINGDAEIQIRAHTRIKIYNQNGLDEANISIPYIPRQGSEIITKLEAQTYNLDGAGNIVISRLDKKSVYDKPVDNMFSKLTFTLPEVKAGSVIEYKYLLRRKMLYFPDFYFQRDIPVVFSNCQFQYPSEFTFKHVPHNNLPVETSSKNVDNSVRLNFIMRNLPGVKPEPFITSTSDYKQRITFDVTGYNPVGGFARDLRSTWPGIIKALMEDEDFGMQIRKNIPRTVELDQALEKLTNPYSRMTAIHQYVRNSMAWDGTTSKWALDGVKKAWEKKRGNSGEINLILVNLLKEAGLKASPMLVSTKDNGRVKPSNPGYTQFNTVMAYVTIDTNFYVLDATDKHTPSKLIPSSVVYSEGLVISKIETGKSISEQDWGWRTLWNTRHMFQRVVNVSCTFDGKDKIQGDAFLIHRDYAREHIMNSVEPAEEKTVSYLTKENANLKLTDLSIRNYTNDSLPLEHSFKFELPVEQNGEYSSFNVNLFSGLEKNPFIAEDRYADVFFGYGQKYTMRGVLSIPDGFVFEDPPKSLKMVMPDKSIELTRIFQVEGNMARYSIDLHVKNPFYSPEDYAEFREFYKKSFSLINEPLVIKKK
jgi:hypothetical protein